MHFFFLVKAWNPQHISNVSRFKSVSVEIIRIKTLLKEFKREGIQHMWSYHLFSLNKERANPSELHDPSILHQKSTYSSHLRATWSFTPQQRWAGISWNLFPLSNCKGSRHLKVEGKKLRKLLIPTKLNCDQIAACNCLTHILPLSV